MTQDAKQRMKWWRDSKFGMFVHWGCYSVLGRGEQIMARDCMTLNNSQGWGNIKQSIADKTPGEVRYNFMEAVRQGSLRWPVS